MVMVLAGGHVGPPLRRLWHVAQTFILILGAIAQRNCMAARFVSFGLFVPFVLSFYALKRIAWHGGDMPGDLQGGNPTRSFLLGANPGGMGWLYTFRWLAPKLPLRGAVPVIYTNFVQIALKRPKSFHPPRRTAAAIPQYRRPPRACPNPGPRPECAAIAGQTHPSGCARLRLPRPRPARAGPC